MDFKDRRILYELGLNSRLTNKNLAKKIGLGESSTINRVDNLIKNKVLLGTQTIIDNSRLGYQGYRIYLAFYSTTTEEESAIFEWLKQQKVVSVLAKCSGSIDAGIICWTKDRKDFENFVSSLKENFREKIKDIDVSIYSETYHFSRDYLLNNIKSRNIIKIGNNDLVEHDEFDFKILESIYSDARKSILDIASELKKPPRTVAFRLRQLEKRGIIAGYTINLNTSLIGYEYYKLNISLSKSIKYNDLYDFASKIKNTVYLDKTVSKYDLELNVEVKNKIELQKIVDEIKDTFKGIKEMSWFQVDSYLKIHYL